MRYSKHYCTACRRHFSLQAPGLAPASGKYTFAMRELAIRGMSAGKTLEKVGAALRVPPTTIYDWREHNAATA